MTMETKKDILKRWGSLKGSELASVLKHYWHLPETPKNAGDGDLDIYETAQQIFNSQETTGL